MAKPETITWGEILEEFYEVCIHTLLYSRSIYPANVFEPRRYLGTLTWQSRHPEINAYIKNVLSNASKLIHMVYLLLNSCFLFY